MKNNIAHSKPFVRSSEHTFCPRCFFAPELPSRFRAELSDPDRSLNRAHPRKEATP